MSSWVRYSVAVYVGLLLAGSMMAPRPGESVGAEIERLQVPWLGPVSCDAPVVPHHLDPCFDHHWLVPVTLTDCSHQGCAPRCAAVGRDSEASDSNARFDQPIP